jgi:predicted metal-dependent enzyme (double-stranded beta helix superfamily)
MTGTQQAEALAGLVAAVSAAVAAGGGEQAVTASVAESLRAGLSEGIPLAEAVTRPDPQRYVMYPLHVAADKSFSIAAAVWGPGQQTPVHDHGVWGVVGIHSGTEREVRFERATDGPLRELGEHVWSPGDVTVCCTSDQDLHQVSCASAEPCVGLHIYGGDIGTIRRRAYDPATGEVSYFVSSWARVDRGEQ